MRRPLITLLFIAAAIFVVWALAGDPPADPAPEAPEAPRIAEEPAPETPAVPDAPPPPPVDEPDAPPEPDIEPIPGLQVVPVVETQPEPTLGSTDPDEQVNPYALEVQFTPFGGGIRHLLLSRYSTRVDEHVPYTLQQRLPEQYLTAERTVETGYRYPMAAYAVEVNDTRLFLYHHRWRYVQEESDERTAAFEITLADGDDNPVLRITRVWRIQPERYDVSLEEGLENLSDQPLRVKLTQYGPFDLPSDGGYIGDRRHLVMGYLRPHRAGAVPVITTDGFDINRNTIIRQDDPVVWPAAGDDPDRTLVWGAMTNRYFAAALYGQLDRTEPDPAIVPLEHLFPTTRREAWTAHGEDHLGLLFESRDLTLAAAGQGADRRRLDLEFFAGPKDPDLLRADPAFAQLRLDELVIYNLGGFCAILTFAWLANLLMGFLSLISSIIADWGVAIMVLVVIVRVLLHPITKRSQINMMKMGKQMQALQPEMERIKKKYKDDSAKLNQEMMKLYRDKGVNPAAMGLGCLPMFLQMPIWFALYAMLYFAIELRHEQAFWGVFQAISGGQWLFLADLSSQDGFIPLPNLDLYFFTLESINLLPLLMVVVFYLQQKYTMAASPALSEQARQQQMIMKWVIMIFPFILYKMPSGLNLYILASTAWGVIESRIVRKHLKELEDQGRLFEKKKPKPGGFMERMMKAAEERQRMLEEQKAGRAKPERGKGEGGGDGRPGGGRRGGKGKRKSRR